MLYCVCGCVAVWLCGCGCGAVAVAVVLWLWLCGCGAVVLWCCGAVAMWLCAAVVAAAVMRKDPKRGYVTDATPRRSGFQRMLESNRTTGTVSGSGVDKGIGQHADVLLGLWSCCRNVDPVMQGCVRAEAHTRTMLKCRQCGVFYNHLDNQSSKLRGAPNCSYHPREPQTGTLVARTVWGSAGVWRQLMRGGPASRCCTWQRILAVLWHRRLRELEIPLRVPRQPANVPRQQRRRVGVGLPQRCVWHVLRRNSGANAGTLLRYGAWHAQVTTSHSWRRCLLTLLARPHA